MDDMIKDAAFVVFLVCFFTYITATISAIAENGSLKIKPAYWLGICLLALGSVTMAVYLVTHIISIEMPYER